MDLRIDAKLKSALKDIVRRRDALTLEKDQIAADLKALASAAGVKPADLAKVLALYEKERSQLGVIQHEQGVLDAAQQLV